MTKFFKFSLLFLLLFIFVSCSDDKKYDKSKAISLLQQSENLSADPRLLDYKITLPAQQNSTFSYTHSCSNRSDCQIPQNFKKSFEIRSKHWFSKKTDEIYLTKKHSLNSFYLGDSKQNFVYSPVIIKNIGYFLNSNGNLSAINLDDFKKIWRKSVFSSSSLKNYRTAKLSACNEKLFAVDGTNEIVAISQSDGQVLWRKELSSIIISSPICDGSSIFVSSDNNKIFSINASNGNLKWSSSGINRPTAIFGSADPVLAGDKVIAAYSSGEIVALSKESGDILWNHELSLNKVINSDFYLNDVDATPIIFDNVVYAIGNGGLMKAISLKNGEILWKKEIASVIDFWIAGDLIFLINNDSKLIAIQRKKGLIKYVFDLPAYKKIDKPTSKLIYSGIIMAGNKLLISRTDGILLIASPFDGKIESEIEVGGRLFSKPIVVNEKIYLLSIDNFSVEFSQWL